MNNCPLGCALCMNEDIEETANKKSEEEFEPEVEELKEELVENE